MYRLWIGAGLLFLLLFVPVFHHGADASSDVRYYYNQERFPEIEQMIYSTNGRTMVPFRPVFELLDANVTYDAPNRRIHADSPAAQITMTIGDAKAVVNDERVILDSKPVVRNGRTFVPLRFVSEAMGAEVKWDGSERAIHVLMIKDREETLSEGEGPDEKVPDREEPVNSLTEALWTDRLSEMAYESSSESKYGFYWHTDQKEPFTRYGTDDSGELLGLFTMETGHLPFSDRHGAIDVLGEPMTWLNKEGLFFQYSGDDTWDFYESDDYYLTLFYAPWDGDRLAAVQLIDKDVEEASEGYYGANGDHLAADFEELFFHTINAVRERHGLSALEWYESLQPVARAHSSDMSNNDYFNHNDLNGRTPFERIREADIDYTLAGENLARNHLSPFHAVFSLMNSEGHRENILKPEYSHTAVGVAYADQKPYVTQKFIKRP